ncbi:rhodanese-like domain-containing protein [candidate division KSB1 bacterium]|nr:rhodanese-like domain-containing protein [candidate division KSB1 bacterium]RQW02723.1 MAG: rhodanese-like domain-containing protein [candidate division KSB1 bacterium]
MNVKKLAAEIGVVFAAAALLGFATNDLNPNGVKISINRPVKQTADAALQRHQELDSAEPIVIGKEQLKRLVQAKDIIIIDTRTPQEFLQGRIPNAINIPFERLEESIETIDSLAKTSWIVTYCDGPPCDKAQLLAAELIDMGFARVAYYDAGLDDWKKTEGVQQ